MQRIDAGRHAILVADGLLDRLGELLSDLRGASTIAIVSDSDVAPLYAERARTALACAGAQWRSELFVVPAGERSKSRREWAALTDAMLARGLGRDSAVIALGGGVVGDLAGFVAATYARGVPVIQVPTSLLAMVDAAIGGKTGVDTPAGKNLVGAFHWPAVVVVDPTLLATLPPEHWRAGFAEMLKHGAIADEAHFRRLAAVAASLPNVAARALTALIAESIAIKARIVSQDERESGPRRALNAGHTLAHAVEHASGYGIPHGHAVAIGLVLEAAIGEGLGVTASGTADALRDTLRSAGLPFAAPEGLDPGAILAATRVDKKRRQGHVEYALLARIGAIDEAGGDFCRRIADADVLHVLQAAR